jgi:hypothetical protein
MLSGEFTEDGLDDQQAQKGLWLVLQTDDVEGLQQKVQAFTFPFENWNPKNLSGDPVQYGGGAVVAFRPRMRV